MNDFLVFIPGLHRKRLPGVPLQDDEVQRPPLPSPRRAGVVHLYLLSAQLGRPLNAQPGHPDHGRACTGHRPRW